MRFFKFTAVSLVMIFFLMLGITISGAYAGNYLGEFCWQGGEGDIARFAVTDMGNGHFLLNGKVTELDGEATAAYGSGEIVGDKGYIVFTHAGSDEYVWSWTGTCILELATMNGNCEGLDIYYNKASGYIGIEYDSYTYTFIQCPE